MFDSNSRSGTAGSARMRSRAAQRAEPLRCAICVKSLDVDVRGARSDWLAIAASSTDVLRAESQVGGIESRMWSDLHDLRQQAGRWQHLEADSWQRHDDRAPGDRERARELLRAIRRRPDAATFAKMREVSIAEVAAAVGRPIRRSLSRAEAGDAERRPSRRLSQIATALGCEPSVRLYPATGPRIRDHIQVA